MWKRIVPIQDKLFKAITQFLDVWNVRLQKNIESHENWTQIDPWPPLPDKSHISSVIMSRHLHSAHRGPVQSSIILDTDGTGFESRSVHQILSLWPTMLSADPNLG